jgi:hypothetical protein
VGAADRKLSEPISNCPNKDSEHRHAFRQAKAAGIDVEMTRRPARTAMHLQQLSLPDQIANGDRFEMERLRLAPLLGLFRFCSSSTSSGRLRALR